VTSSNTESLWEDPGLERQAYRIFVNSLTSCTQFRWSRSRFVEVLPRSAGEEISRHSWNCGSGLCLQEFSTDR